jgi:hypothetical protein
VFARQRQCLHAALGQAQHARVTIEELEAEQPLQFLELRADAGLRQAQRFTGSGETTLLRNRDKHFQLT